MSIRKHINNECISFSFTLDWNVNLAIEIDFLFWTFDFILIKHFRQGRKRNKIERHRQAVKGE